MAPATSGDQRDALAAVRKDPSRIKFRGGSQRLEGPSQLGVASAQATDPLVLGSVERVRAVGAAVEPVCH